MTIHYTDEMLELSDLIRPWRDGRQLKKDAPIEIIEAEKRFKKLFDEQYEFELSLL